MRTDLFHSSPPPEFVAPSGQEGLCPYNVMLPRSIGGKLLFSFVVVALLAIVAITIAIYAMWRIEDKVGIIESFYELNQNVLEVRRYEKNYLLYNNQEDLMSALGYLDQVRATIATLKKALPQEEGELQTFSVEELERYEDIFRQLLNTQLPERRKRLLESSLRRHGQEITTHIFDLDTEARFQVEQEVANYQKTGVFILGLAILVGGVLVFYLIRWIMRPLAAIREAAAQIMQGKMNSIPINEDIVCSVEGLELVNSLNRMLQALDAKQEQLVQSEKLAAVGKVTAGIAHEINNPLNNISLTAEVLLEDLPNLDCHERFDMVRDILTQSDRARNVVHHLLEFSRTRKSEVVEVLDMARLVEDSIVLVKNQFRLGGITYRYDQPEQAATVLGNANQLQQVLVNIMLNAVQAMTPGGQLTLSVERQGKEVVVAISDTGAGIAPELVPRIFDPFFTTKNEGTGLGLSLSYSIVKDHQGDIEVGSQEGRGTTFRIRLPLAPIE
jgi:signal transduction histidine kinase